MCRYLYNWSLSERIEEFQNSENTISYNIQQNNLPELKKERPWFKSVHSQVLQDVLRRLDNGYQTFFRRVKNGETSGFPKFRKRGQWNSITYPQYSSFPSSHINVSKVGIVKIVYHREIPQEASIKTLTIIKESCKWFAKAKKRSPKYHKLLRAIQKCHYKIRCQRNDFLYKTANDLLKFADIICHENLNSQNMSRRPKPITDENGKFLPNRALIKAGLNKSINDAGWYKFLLQLKYKAIEQGKQSISVPPHYTSQKCSACGKIVKKSLSVRTHRCSCGFVANRDHNAALNILRIGLDTLAASAV